MERPPITLETAWQRLVTRVKPWNIGRLELTYRRDPIIGRRYWIDPGIDKVQECRWSIAVSIEGRDQRLCEITADGWDKPLKQGRLNTLTEHAQVNSATVLRAC